MSDLIFIFGIVMFAIQTYRLHTLQIRHRDAAAMHKARTAVYEAEIAEHLKVIRDSTETISVATQILTDARSGTLKDRYELPTTVIDKIDKSEWPDELGEK